MPEKSKLGVNGAAEKNGESPFKTLLNEIRRKPVRLYPICFPAELKYNNRKKLAMYYNIKNISKPEFFKERTEGAEGVLVSKKQQGFESECTTAVIEINKELSKLLKRPQNEYNELLTIDHFGAFCTNPRYRAMIDLFIDYPKFAVYAKNIKIEEEEFLVNIEYTFDAKDYVIPNKIHKKCMNVSYSTNEGSITCIIPRFDIHEVTIIGKVAHLNLCNTVQINFNCKEFLFDYTYDSCVINAENAIFLGETRFENLSIEKANFDGALFWSNWSKKETDASKEGERNSNVIFKNIHFDTKETINFRNACFCVNELSFENCRCLTEHYGEISFEDARFHCESKSTLTPIFRFYNCTFEKVYLNFFQSIIEGHFVFLESVVAECHFNFEDSFICYLEFEGVRNFPYSDFCLKYARFLRIVNCELCHTLRFSHSIQYISFNGTINNGCSIMLIENQDERYRIDDIDDLLTCFTQKLCTKLKNTEKLDFIQAIIDRQRVTLYNNDKGPITLPKQLSMVKEVFHDMGNYTLEDKAYVEYKRAVGFKKKEEKHRAKKENYILKKEKCHLNQEEDSFLWRVKNLFSKKRDRGSSLPKASVSPVLYVLSKYGTSWERIVLWAVSFAVVAFLCNWLIFYHIGYVFENNFLFITSLLRTTLSALMTFNFPTDVNWISLVGILEGIFMWFFMGYFFIAFTRKTLR